MQSDLTDILGLGVVALFVVGFFTIIIVGIVLESKTNNPATQHDKTIIMRLKQSSPWQVVGGVCAILALAITVARAICE